MKEDSYSCGNITHHCLAGRLDRYDIPNSMVGLEIVFEHERK